MITIEVSQNEEISGGIENKEGKEASSVDVQKRERGEFFNEMLTPTYSE